MKTRDSGMPDEAYWSTFFDPDAILATLGLNHVSGDVIDVGAGYGTFTLALARRTAHRVIALDIDSNMVELIARKAASEGVINVRAQLHDVTSDGLGVEPARADIVLLFNLLHCENPLSILEAAHLALRIGGRVGVIHWRSDIVTPRGPHLSIRPSPDQCVRLVEQVGFQVINPWTVLPPYHFGFVGTKPHHA